MTKRLFMIKYDFFDVVIAKNVANKTNEINDEVDNICDDICDDILNTTKNINTTSEVNKVYKVKKIWEVNVLNFFAWWFLMCSWNLMLLENLTKQRLQTKTFKRFFFKRFFFKRVFSTFCCCFAKRFCSIYYCCSFASWTWFMTYNICWANQRACSTIEAWFWRVFSFWINYWHWYNDDFWWNSYKRWWLKILTISTRFKKQWQREKNQDIEIMI